MYQLIHAVYQVLRHIPAAFFCLLTQFILPRGRIQTNETIPECMRCISDINMLFVSSLFPLLTINTPFAFLMVTKLRAVPFLWNCVNSLISFPEWLQPVQSPQLLMGDCFPHVHYFTFQNTGFHLPFFHPLCLGLESTFCNLKGFSFFLTFYSLKVFGGCVHCSFLRSLVNVLINTETTTGSQGNLLSE